MRAAIRTNMSSKVAVLVISRVFFFHLETYFCEGSVIFSYKVLEIVCFICKKDRKKRENILMFITST